MQGGLRGTELHPRRDRRITAAGTIGNTGATARKPAGEPALADECAVPSGFDPPFTHAYALRSGGTLVFVAVHHGPDIEDVSHRQIESAIDKYKPSFILVEGAASSKTFAGVIRFLVDAADRQFWSGAIQENLFAVKLASDRRIAFSGWDFSPDEDVANSVGDGFTIADVIGTHLIRAKVDPFAGSATDSAIAREVAYAARVGPTGSFDYAAWYKKIYGNTFDQAYGTPCGAGVGGRVAKYESNRRNLNLIGLIKSHATPGAVILVEAGANHWLALRDYLSSVSNQSR